MDPAGVGKGTPGALASPSASGLASSRQRGVLYRLTALAAMRAGVAFSDEPRLTALARDLDVGSSRGGRGRTHPSRRCRCQPRNCAWSRSGGAALERSRSARRAAGAAGASARFSSSSAGAIADGRDMGTVVFPDARLKIFLDASVEERARRRWLQLSAQGVNANLVVLLRGHPGSRRARPQSQQWHRCGLAEEAVVIDTTALFSRASLVPVRGSPAGARFHVP